MKVIIRILSAAVLFLTAVIPVFQSHGAQWLWLLLPCFFLLNVFPSYVNRRLPDRRLRLCADGCELLILFLISAVLSGLYLLTRIPALWPEPYLGYTCGGGCVLERNHPCIRHIPADWL